MRYTNLRLLYFTLLLLLWKPRNWFEANLNTYHQVESSQVAFNFSMSYIPTEN